MKIGTTWIVVFGLLMAAFPATPAMADTVGVISDVSGEVELHRGDDVFAAEPGVNVEPGDELVSGEGASAQLDMDDGSSLALGASSTMRIRDYSLREDRSVLSAAIELVGGWLRFAVAKLRSRDSSYRFHMPTAVLGVRGTEGVLEVTGEGDEAESRAALEEGEVELAEKLEHGRLAGRRLVLRPGQYAARRRAHVFRFSRHVPARFRRRMPPRLRARLVRRAHLLRRRGIHPRWLRHRGPGVRHRHRGMRAHGKRMRGMPHGGPPRAARPVHPHRHAPHGRGGRPPRR